MRKLDLAEWSFIPGPRRNPPETSLDLHDIVQYSPEEIARAFMSFSGMTLRNRGKPTWWEWSAQWQNGKKIIQVGMTLFVTENDVRSIPESRTGRFALLSVHDTGCGMDAKTRSQIFEPFFTTKEVGKGTGLGLAMVYGIIRQSNGFIDVDSMPQKGTTFNIYLPLTLERKPREMPVVEVDQSARGHETVLLVEDEEMVRGMTRTLLQKSGYRVLEARDGHDAVHVADSHNGAIHLLVTDVVMPGMNGRDLQQKLAQRRPEMRVLFMSGYTDSALLRHGVLDAELTILLKPFQPEVFLSTVREVLDK